MFNDALNDGLIDANPFARLGFKKSRGAADKTPVSATELYALANLSVACHGEAYGPTFSCSDPRDGVDRDAGGRDVWHALVGHIGRHPAS
jgi:hypothetical protein